LVIKCQPVKTDVMKKDNVFKLPALKEYEKINSLFDKGNQQEPRLSADEKVIDHILYFDPDDPSTQLKTSSPQPELMATIRLPLIPWPAGLAPLPQTPAAAPVAGTPLPKTDILIVTWTVAEALALSDVLTPGFRSKTDWFYYTHNWETDFEPIIKKGAPALLANRLGSWYPTKIGNKNVICFKSELHFARDGAKIPVQKLWLQLIAETQASIIITTGTAGGIGSAVQLGDVALTEKVRFDCNKTFKSEPFAQQQYLCEKVVPVTKVSLANSELMSVTTSFLPQSNRTSTIITQPAPGLTPVEVVTTDFFAFDDTTNYFKLQNMGLAVEMGDAVLGLACSSLGEDAPAWLAIRNASDPQIDGTLTYSQQVEQAARIYEKYGYWTTVNSAIACWSVVASQ